MFLQNVHTFRAFAIFGVVAAHSLHNFSWSSDSVTFALADTLFNQSTVWFAFIAGFLFQHLSRNFKTSKYYWSKVQNVITPYLLWSVPAIFAVLTITQKEMPNGFYDLGLIEQSFLLLITGKHLAPYWYIPSITLIFLLAPLLIMVDRSKYGYLILIPLLISSALLGRYGIQSEFGLGGYGGQVSKAYYLIAPYLLGMFASRHRLTIDRLTEKFFYPLIFLSVVFFLWHALGSGNHPAPMFIYKCLSSFVLLRIFTIEFGRLQPYIDTVAEYSFGIFFLHGFLLGIEKLILLRVFDLQQLPAGNFFFHLLFSCSVVAICCISLTLSKPVLGKRSRLIVGC